MSIEEAQRLRESALDMMARFTVLYQINPEEVYTARQLRDALIRLGELKE